MPAQIGLPPNSVTRLLRLEGFVALAGAIAAYHLTGGNWWLFALLLLAPDLTFFAYSAGEKTGAQVYNLAHTYTVPALLGLIGWATGAMWIVHVALIWGTHIGLDRSIGYGLKYPGLPGHTHLGLMGKGKKGAARADAR